MPAAAFPEAPFEFAMFDWIEDSGRPVADIIDHKLRLVEMADRAGFYGWHIAEHQATPLSVDISPALVLAAAIQRTQRLRMGALTFCLPWYNPYRFYNEVCMLDQMSRGRLELGVGRGVSLFESAVYGITDLEEARGRYRETLDIFMTACGKRTLDYEGVYHSYHDVELYTHPYQKPSPPLWFPSSVESGVPFIAAHGYNTVFSGPEERVRAMLDQYREIWLERRDDEGRHNAHVAAPHLGRSHHVLVADTDAEAEAIAAPAHQVWADHIQHLWRKNGQVAGISTQRGRGDQAVIAGSPKTVARQLLESVKATGINYAMLVFSYGDMAPEHAERSMELFISDVMPVVRAELDGTGALAGAG